VLFLDGLPEFHRCSLARLRLALGPGVVTVARGLASTTFPAGSMLVAAMNPCPCGCLGDARHACSGRDWARYSGPNGASGRTKQ
jgi:magnesium chelatase family protein